MFGKKTKPMTDEKENIATEEEWQEFEDVEGTKPKKKKLPNWVIIPILLVICLIAFLALKLSSGGSDKGKAVTVADVEKGDVKELYSVSGTLESEKTKTFISPVTAPIAACNAQVGKAVKSGQLLISYDTTDLEKNNQESQLQLQSTQAGNQSTRESADAAAGAAVSAQESQIQQLEQQVAAAQEQADSLWAAADAAQSSAADVQAVNQALTEQIDQKQAEFDGKQEEQTTLQTELQELTAEKDTAQSQMNNYENLPGEKPSKEELAKILSEYPEKANVLQTKLTDLQNVINTLQSDIDQLKSQMGNADPAAAIAAAQAADEQVAAAQAGLDQARSSGTGTTGITSGQSKSMNIAENLAELSALSVSELLQKGRDGIKAEFDGVISDVQVSAGAAATQGAPLFTIVSNQSVSLKVEVPSNDFDKLVKGSKATITVGKKTYNGTLSVIDKIALENKKGNPVVGAQIHIDNPDEDLVIGVTAKASLRVAEKKNVLKIPSEIVNTGTGGDFVYVVKENAVKKQTVQLGITSNSEVEVIAGLEEGDQVIVSAAGDLEEGMQVTTTKDSAK